MNVLITIDTEAWPRDPGWRHDAMRRDIGVDIHGQTAQGRFGIEHQMDVMDAHGVKGVFLVEALSSLVLGPESLRETVATIQARGHEVQLHLHPEWLAWMEPSILPGRTGQNMKDFDEAEQEVLIRRGLGALREAGARDTCAFRAGNYGADFATLRALAANGIRFDTSHNACYLDTDCGLATPEPLIQPRLIEGVWEFPVSVFRDYPGHRRHAQLCACSAKELESALLRAGRQGWHAFVIVSHSFELIRGRRTVPRPDRIVARRFERLSGFLGRNRDRFRTCGFADLAGEPMREAVRPRPLASPARLTAGRLAQQLVRRFT